jgi:single-stranded-DNA-specific exonuclease
MTFRTRAWIDPEEFDPPPDLVDAAGGSHLAAKALWRRGVRSAQAALPFLDPDAYTPTTALELPGMEQAARRVLASVEKGEPVLVWGDFDVDGQTSTSLLVGVLRSLGAEAAWYIPIRERESHGVHKDSLSGWLDQGIRLVLTCDTGSAAHEAVSYAKSRGIDTVITDHHELPASLPECAALVNPNLLPDGHPLSTLPGVGVAYKLAEALYQMAGRAGEESSQLDLAALGIVADVARLHGDARWLLQKGLQSLRLSQRSGLQAIYELADLQPAGLTEEHIGFVIGPRLNALGRLGDANPAVELLTTSDLGRARVLSAQLESFNARRKLLTDQVFQGALAQVERDPALLEPAALVLSHPGWPAGVIGIVASRLVERFQRPVVLLSAPEGQAARGSARSVEGCHITEAISECADLLNGFGGHPMAAGMSLNADKIAEFRHRLGGRVGKQLEGRPAAGLEIDAYLSLEEANLELAADLSRLAPFGAGCPPVTLAARSLRLKSQTPLGRSGEHLQLIVEDESGCSQKVVWWGGSAWEVPEERFDLAFNLRASSYRGERQVQIEWVDARPGPPVEPVEVSPQRRVIDLRRQTQPLAFLKELAAGQELQVWAEAEAVQALQVHGIQAADRHSLQPGPGLIVWTTPAGLREWAAVLEQVSPEIVYIFAVDPETGQVQPFLRRLAGLVKYSLKEMGGRVSLSRLASACAQPEAAVRVGLEWLEQRGAIRMLEGSGDERLLAPGSGSGSLRAETAALLEAILDESAAYREYFSSAEKKHLA